jgi:hypothetical protein
LKSPNLKQILIASDRRIATLTRLSSIGILFVLLVSSFYLLPSVAPVSHASSGLGLAANQSSLQASSPTASYPSTANLLTSFVSWISHGFSAPGSIRGLNAASCAAKPVCINFTETGLPGNTIWQVTFNSTTYSNATTSSGVGAIYIGGLTYGDTYYWSTSPSIQISIATRYTIENQAYSAYMTLPNPSTLVGGQLTQALVYTQQYNVTVAVAAGTTSDGYTSPYMGSYWYNAGSVVPISLATLYGGCGCAFASWTSTSAKLKLASTTSSATTATVNSAGTITANFKTLTYSITFVQAGLAKGTSWSVTLGTNTQSNTTSLANGAGQITFTGLSYGSHYWTPENPVPSTLSGEQFIPVDQYGGSVFVPSQSVQEVVFDKQYEVSFSMDYTTGTQMSPSPGSWWYNAGSVVPISAWYTETPAPSGGFAKWSTTGSLVLGSSTVQSTTMTVNGPGTVQADFAGTVNACGSSATPCNLKFVETGLPSGTIWSVKYAPNGESTATTFHNNTNTILVHNVTAPGYAVLATNINGGNGVQYVPSYYICQSNFCQQSPPGNEYYMDVPGQILLQVVYTKQYLVTFETSTPGTGTVYHSGATLGSSSSTSYLAVWFYAGSNISVAADPSTSYPYAFKSWTHSGSITLSSTSRGSVFAQINGAGSITANIILLTYTVKFTEVGLPSGTIWSVLFNGLVYSSSTTTISVTGVGGGSSYSWSADQDVSGGIAGTRYDASSDYYGTINVPSQTTQMVVYTKQFEVSFIECGGGTCTTSENDGYIIPSVGSYWYNANSKIAITTVPTSDSDNPADMESFVSWSVSSGSLITIASIYVQSTYVTIAGPGTITGEVT